MSKYRVLPFKNLDQENNIWLQSMQKPSEKFTSESYVQNMTSQSTKGYNNQSSSFSDMDSRRVSVSSLPPQSSSISQMQSQHRFSKVIPSNRSSLTSSPNSFNYIDDPNTFHFHECKKSNCLDHSNHVRQQQQQQQLQQQLNSQRNYSFSKSQSPVSVSSERQFTVKKIRQEKPALMPVNFSIKLPEENISVNSIGNSNVRADSFKRASSVTNIYSTGERGSPFTYIETKSIKKMPVGSPHKVNRSMHSMEESRSARSTPARAVSPRSKQNHKTFVITKLSPNMEKYNKHYNVSF